MGRYRNLLLRFVMESQNVPLQGKEGKGGGKDEELYSKECKGEPLEKVMM